MSWDSYIFDLDGTLLNTLEDLSLSLNFALKKYGLPQKDEKQVKFMVGSGVRRLVELAVEDENKNPFFQEVFSTFMTHYLEHSMDNTRPYPGIIQMLKGLKDRGKKMAIVSNKAHKATEALAKNFFSEYISVAIGETPKIKRKPSPDTIFEAMRLLGAKKSSTIYVGDSDVDIMTAKNSGIESISVLWGFRDRDFLLSHGAKRLISSPKELLEI